MTDPRPARFHRAPPERLTMTVQLLKPGAKILLHNNETGTLVDTACGGTITRVRLDRRRRSVARRPACESTPSVIILDTGSANVSPDPHPLIRCADCMQTLGWYGQRGVGYLHMKTGIREFGQFYGTSHAVPVHQRHNSQALA